MTLVFIPILMIADVVPPEFDKVINDLRTVFSLHDSFIQNWCRLKRGAIFNSKSFEIRASIYREVP